MLSPNIFLRSARLSLRYLFSTSPSLDSIESVDFVEEKEESPFYFGNTTHILGYTGLVPINTPQLRPEAYQERLAVVKAKFEDCSLSPSNMLELVYSCSSIQQIEEFLGFVSDYRNTIFPDIAALPIALTRTLLHLDRPDMALQVFQKHSQYSLFPDCPPISLLMDALLKRDEYELALDTYELLEQVFTPVNEIATAVGAFAHVCEGSTALMLEARELISRLHNNGWRFAADALRIVFVILKRQGRGGEARRLATEFAGSGYFDSNRELGEIVNTFIHS